jgi:integrase/recombinase XerD
MALACRVAEVAALKVDSERMLLRVEHGKGGRYRNAMLPADLLTLLREWWKVGHQQGVMHRDGWLFPGQHAMKPISTRQLRPRLSGHPCRTPEPSSAQGHVGDRALPQGGSGRSYRGLRGGDPTRKWTP